MTGIARVGISGWRYEPWRGVFCPPELRHRDELACASRKMATIEINGSFHSLQRPEYYASWYEQTPPGFVFSVMGASAGEWRSCSRSRSSSIATTR